MLHRHYYSVSQKMVDGKGQRNIVQIENGKQGMKVVEKLDSRGQVIKRKTRKLTTKEKKDILKGVFVPGLWRNCSLVSTRNRRNRRSQ